MKKTPLILSIVALAGVVALALAMILGCCNKTKKVEAGDDNASLAGEIVYFNLDRVLEEYDYANDLRSVAQTKIESINQEVNRRGSKLERDVNAFQDKINKGLITRSVAEVQSQKLSQQQQEFQNYAAQKQQEVAEEQAVMMNNIADAIKTFVDAYNLQMGYAMIIASQGDILPTPVVTGDESLDITDAIIEGLNAAYVKTKSEK